VEKGTLIEFWPNGERRLAVVDRPDGKTNWIVVDERSQSHSLHPRKVTYEVKGETYKPADIPKFLKQVEAYLDPSSLEVAWELLVEDSETIDTAGMALLLFSEQSPPLCYAAHCLLSDDKIYFKKKGDCYQPRTVVMVTEIKHQLEVEEQKRREQQEFLTRLQQAASGEKVEWQESDRPRIEAIERFVLQPESASRAVQELLAALGRSQNP
jgi:exoribonuclease-2